MPSTTILKDALHNEIRLKLFFDFKTIWAMKWPIRIGTLPTWWQIWKIVACTYIRSTPIFLIAKRLEWSDLTFGPLNSGWKVSWKSLMEIVNSTLALQRDLIKLEEWSNTWLLKFHPDKCKVLTLGFLEKIERPRAFLHELHGTVLEHVSEEKDLAVRWTIVFWCPDWWQNQQS